jgi:hypothetical protein
MSQLPGGSPDDGSGGASENATKPPNNCRNTIVAEPIPDRLAELLKQLAQLELLKELTQLMDEPAARGDKSKRFPSGPVWDLVSAPNCTLPLVGVSGSGGGGCGTLNLGGPTIWRIESIGLPTRSRQPCFPGCG